MEKQTFLRHMYKIVCVTQQYIRIILFAISTQKDNNNRKDKFQQLFR